MKLLPSSLYFVLNFSFSSRSSFSYLLFLTKNLRLHSTLLPLFPSSLINFTLFISLLGLLFSFSLFLSALLAHFTFNLFLSTSHFLSPPFCFLPSPLVSPLFSLFPSVPRNFSPFALLLSDPLFFFISDSLSLSLSLPS